MFLFLAVLLYVVYVVTNKKGSSETKIKGDVETLREEIKDNISNLVPWNREEMELFSLSETSKNNRKRGISTINSVVSSIYHEPLMSYIYKDFGNKRDYKMLLVKTSNREYVYIIKKDVVNIFLNDKPFASIKDNAYLYPPGENKLLAAINLEGGAYLPLKVQDREVASLTHPQKTDRVNPRAFEILQQVDNREEELLLALSFFTIIREKNKIVVE